MRKVLLSLMLILLGHISFGAEIKELKSYPTE